MSRSFEPEEKDELIQALGRIRKNVIYITEQLESVIMRGFPSASPDAVKRVVSMMDEFMRKLQRPADSINLLMMEHDMGLSSPGENENP